MQDLDKIEKVKTVVCRVDPENEFRVRCIIETKNGKKEVGNLYGYFASDPMTTAREVDRSGFYYGLDGKGFCEVDNYTLLDGNVVKVLKCHKKE